MPKPEQIFNDALQQHQAGDLVAAKTGYLQVLKEVPDHFDTMQLLGTLYAQSGDYPAAIEWLEKATLLQPDVAIVHSNIGLAYQKLGQSKNAEASFRQALSLAEDNAEAQVNLGNALVEQEKFSEAEKHYRQALVLNADYPQALNNLANTLLELERFDEACDSCLQAIKLKPDYAEAYYNLGLARKATGELPLAEDNFRRAIHLQPAYVSAHFNLAELLLASGRMEQGWRHYEWRLQQDLGLSTHNSPKWHGEPLFGKSLLLLAEQGFGDTLLALRYLPYLQSQRCQLFIECKPAIQPLLQANTKDIRFVEKGGALPEADYHLSLMSLPAVLGENLSFSKAAKIPYIEAQRQRVDLWRDKLDHNSFNIGIAWQGNTGYKADKYRSFPLKEFEPIASIDGITLVSLQKGEEGTRQIADFQNNNKLLDFGERLDCDGAFLDTCALIQNLDLVISSCTSIANLAGAMGTPLWVVLGKEADWRWMQQGEQSPWYPNATLFRQDRQQDWLDTFQQIKQSTINLIAANK